MAALVGTDTGGVSFEASAAVITAGVGVGAGAGTEAGGSCTDFFAADSCADLLVTGSDINFLTTGSGTGFFVTIDFLPIDFLPANPADPCNVQHKYKVFFESGDLIHQQVLIFYKT